MVVEPVNGPQYYDRIYRENAEKNGRKVGKDPPADSLRDTARVDLSEEAKKLKKLQEEVRVEGLARERSGAIEKERLKEIRGRIESGYYDKPEVQEEIAELLLDLFLPGNE